ncbi:MAG: hypothetical protein U5K32_05735 [Bacteroidales bacterium]|nr:hypothetical protein [Bacteroidales bacterium]
MSLDSMVDESSNDFFILAMVITVLMVTFLIIFTSKRIKNPLNAIIRASEAVSEGDNKIRIEDKTRPA